MTNQLVYVVVENENKCTNWSTGTGIYTRKSNAVNLANRWHGSSREVVEYELVPTGRRFNKQGELIE